MNNNFTQLGLGTSTIASLGRSLTFNQAKNIFDAAIEYNIRTVDTSNTYGSGDAERLIGKIVKDKRQDFFIISKVGHPYLSMPAFLTPFNQIGKKILQKFKKEKCFKKDYIITNIEKSLKRLNVNYLDAYLLHDMQIEDFIKYKDECFEALYLIKKKGLSKFIGISSNNTDLLREKIKNINLDLIQTEMVFKKENDDLFDKIKNNGCKIIVNSIFSKKIDNNIDIKINILLKKFNISEESKKNILINYCINQKKVDCALFRTSNVNHVKMIGESYKKYKNNFSDLFKELDNLFI